MTSFHRRNSRTTTTKTSRSSVSFETAYELLVWYMVASSMAVGAALFGLGFIAGRTDRKRDREET
jgi:hypothetical protein